MIEEEQQHHGVKSGATVSDALGGKNGLTFHNGDGWGDNLHQSSDSIDFLFITIFYSITKQHVTSSSQNPGEADRKPPRDDTNSYPAAAPAGWSEEMDPLSWATVQLLI